MSSRHGVLPHHTPKGLTCTTLDLDLWEESRVGVTLSKQSYNQATRLHSRGPGNPKSLMAMAHSFPSFRPQQASVVCFLALADAHWFPSCFSQTPEWTEELDVRSRPRRTLPALSANELTNHNDGFVVLCFKSIHVTLSIWEIQCN